MASKRVSPSKAEADPPVSASPASGPPRDALLRQTLDALAAMGGGEVAYMRKFRAADVREMFPQTAQLHPLVEVYALFAADGTPLMLADAREAILSSAWQNDLTMIALH